MIGARPIPVTRPDRQVIELDRLALRMAGLLHGLDMVDIDQVLDKLRTLVGLSTAFDANSDGFRRQIEGFERHYGEPVMPPYGRQ